MKKSAITALVLCSLVLFSGCGSTPKTAENDKNAKPAATEQVKPAAAATEKGSDTKAPAQNAGNTKEQKALGAIPSEKALEYMKKTKDLVIVDVAPRKAYDKGHFTPSAFLSKALAKKRKRNVTGNSSPPGSRCWSTAARPYLPPTPING